MASKEGPKRPLRIFREGLYTMAELATVLRCNYLTLVNYRNEGRFKFIRRGGEYLISGAEIQYIKANGLRPVSDKYRKAAAKKKAEYRARRKAGAPKLRSGGRPKKAKAPAKVGRKKEKPSHA